MAANTGVKIVREFLRDSPCRVAYAVAQRQQKPRRIPSKKFRPQTAPICPSSLSRAVTAHQLLDDPSKSRRRPTTSGRPLKPSRDHSKPPPPSRHRPAEDVRRKVPSVTSLRKRPQQRQVRHPQPPVKPCKICNESGPNRWQNLLQNVAPPKTEFRTLIGKIDTIRTELLAKSGGTLRDSLQLIYEIRRQMDLPGSFLDRVEPGQTQRLSRTNLQKRNSVKSLRFEGGRIVGKDFAGFRKVSNQSGSVTKFKINCAVKPSRKKIDDGPLRKLMVPMLGRADLGTKRVAF